MRPAHIRPLVIALMCVSHTAARASVEMSITASSYMYVTASEYGFGSSSQTVYRPDIENESGILYTAAPSRNVTANGLYTYTNNAGAAEIRIDLGANIAAGANGIGSVQGAIYFTLNEHAEYEVGGSITAPSSAQRITHSQRLSDRFVEQESDFGVSAGTTLDINGYLDPGTIGGGVSGNRTGVLEPGTYYFHFSKYLEDTGGVGTANSMSGVATLNLWSLPSQPAAAPEAGSFLIWSLLGLTVSAGPWHRRARRT